LAEKKIRQPLMTVEEKLSKDNKQVVKGTNFQREMVISEKGKTMIEAQRDSRRQRHLAALKEAEKFVEQFYDSFAQKKAEVRESVKIFLAGSDVEISEIMKGINDEDLLANEIPYVNGIWEKVNRHRQARKDELQKLRNSLDDLKKFQQKGSGGYLKEMRDNLIFIAFYLEPEVDRILTEWVDNDAAKYEQEHVDNDVFHEELVKLEGDKFDQLYQVWKQGVVQFHLLKQ
jgi:hypothetical protein